jgi:hypothetical protein
VTGSPPPPADGPREALGRQVRDVWVQWASEQPDPKPTWLVGWDELDEGQREVDMRIGETLARAAVAAPADGPREATVERAAEVMGQHSIDPTRTDADRNDYCVCGGWISDVMSEGWDDHLAQALADAGLLASDEQAAYERDTALTRVAAAEAVQVRMADSLPDQGPWQAWSERDRAVRGYEGDLSAALSVEVDPVADRTVPATWAGLMQLLDEHYPADVFVGGEGADPGAQIVALVRRLDESRRLNDILQRYVDRGTDEIETLRDQRAHAIGVAADAQVELQNVEARIAAAYRMADEWDEVSEPAGVSLRAVLDGSAGSPETGDTEPAACSKCGTVGCAEDAASGWYDDEPSIVDAHPMPKDGWGSEATPDPAALARWLYRNYGGGTTQNGDWHQPPWAELNDTIRDAWITEANDALRAALAGTATTEQPREPGYQRIADAIAQTVESAVLELHVCDADGGAPVLDPYLRLARLLDKAGLIDWSAFAGEEARDV